MDQHNQQSDFMELDAARRIRVALLAATRLLLVLASMFLLYFFVPIGGLHDVDPTAAWVRLSIVMTAFLAFLGLQVRKVVSASVPQVRAVEAVVECAMAFVFLFALLYLSFSTADPSSFSEPMDRVDALYFTSSTFSTVGFGDIAPTTGLSRGVVSIQMMAGLGVLAMIAKVSFHAAKKGLSRNP